MSEYELPAWKLLQRAFMNSARNRIWNGKLSFHEGPGNRQKNRHGLKEHYSRIEYAVKLASFMKPMAERGKNKQKESRTRRALICAYFRALRLTSVYNSCGARTKVCYEQNNVIVYSTPCERNVSAASH